MANTGLVIFGVIILIAVYYATNIMITPQQKSQLELANQACGLNIGGIPVGSLGQAISPQIAQECDKYKIMAQILSFETPAYAFGLILLIIGLVAGGKKEVIREIIRETPSRKHNIEDEESEDSEVEDKPKKKGRFCTECGARIKPGIKFCEECGKKV